MTPDSAIRFLAGLTAQLDKRTPFTGEFSANLHAAKQELALLHDQTETSSTSILQRDVILFLAQSTL